MIKIRNGRVYDPLNGVSGEVTDLYLEKDRIVAP
jgi:formylmethanofuran dehydrogenase subunit A